MDHPSTYLLRPQDPAFPDLLAHSPIDDGIEDEPEAGPSQPGFSDATPSTRQDGSSAPLGMFQCSFCKKCYNRADHLQRHVRSHSGEKPYPCKVCHKSFGRPDLLKRHAEGHVPTQDDGPKRRKLNAQTAASTRVTQACKTCSASKLKCEEAKPCSRCRTKGLVCEPVHVNMTGSDDVEALSAFSDQIALTGSSQRMEDQLPTPNSSDQSGWNDNIIETDQGFFPDIPGVRYALARSLRIAADYVDQGMATPAIPSTTSMTQEPYDWTNSHFNEDNFRSSVRLAMNAAQIGPVGLDRDPQKSNNEWADLRPEDNDFRDQAKLALPQSLPKQARRKPQTQVLRENLDYTSRDRLLNVVTRNVLPENIEKITRSFPATELYDDFMQHFFNIFIERIDDWIHAGTFKPNHVAAELLTAIIATGAAYQEQHVLRTIGYAMLEQARSQIPKTIELHNNSVRELDIQQAYLLQIETRQYCCNRRKLEMAEAMFQPCVTMLRRGRQFRRREYTTILPEPLLDGESLQDRWRKWAKQEERKRTVYHMFVHDARAAMMFNSTPLVVFSELSLPLPESEPLWWAKSAQEWQSIYQQRGSLTPSRLPSLIDVMQDPSCLTANAEYLDINFTLLVVIHGLWSLICQHREMRSYQAHPNWHTPGEGSTAYYKCSNLLKSLGSIIPHLQPIRPEVMVMYAFVSMNLHISLDELHLVAGKADREDAQRTYFSAKNWFDSPSSRQATYQAGQILRWAREMPRFTIRDFLTSTLYYAALTLWAYGVLSRGRRIAQSNSNSNQTQSSHHQQQQQQYQHHSPASASPPSSNFLVSLDMAPMSPDPEVFHYENDPIPSFLNDGRGRPCINHYRTEIAELEDPTLICDELQHTLQGNWDQGPPELVKGTRKLIMDLGNAAKLP